MPTCSTSPRIVGAPEKRSDECCSGKDESAARPSPTASMGRMRIENEGVWSARREAAATLLPPPTAPPTPAGARPRSHQRGRQGLSFVWAWLQRGSLPAFHAAPLTTPLLLPPIGARARCGVEGTATSLCCDRTAWSTQVGHMGKPPAGSVRTDGRIPPPRTLCPWASLWVPPRRTRCWAAAPDLYARKWPSKFQEDQATFPRTEPAWGRAVRRGQSVGPGSAEVRRVNGHHLPHSFPRTAQPPTRKSPRSRVQVNWS